jgi:hypothetical protein
MLGGVDAGLFQKIVASAALDAERAGSNSRTLIPGTGSSGQLNFSGSSLSQGIGLFETVEWSHHSSGSMSHIRNIHRLSLSVKESETFQVPYLGGV